MFIEIPGRGHGVHSWLIVASLVHGTQTDDVFRHLLYMHVSSLAVKIPVVSVICKLYLFLVELYRS
jgi:hypothetical protein